MAESEPAPGMPESSSGPPGFRYAPGFLEDGEAHALLGHVEGLPFHEVRMRGVTAKRTVVHYGWDYGYESWRITPAAPLPALLLPLRKRAGALAGLAAETLEQALVARYPPGAGIGWHRDAPMFGPTVVGFSIGAPCLMRFRRGPGDPALLRVTLAPGSAYVLGGPARASWQHSISPVGGLRYSITFRTLRGAPVGREPRPRRTSE